MPQKKVIKKMVLIENKTKNNKPRGGRSVHLGLYVGM